ncbi:MAG TPA: DUF2336 domain-containing protein [Roseomonas sp.]|jgi:uncharacterized protein (DUF2336 family)
MTLFSPTDPAVLRRAAMAGRREASAGELLAFAADPDPSVRQAVAAHREAPAAARELLARDPDPLVRAMLAARIAALPRPPAGAELDATAIRLQRLLERLVEDTEVLVRAAIADAVKDLPGAPRELVLRLARDIEMPVAAPVIQLSPLLTDADLLALIAAPPAAGSVIAVARRPALSERVSEAIIARRDGTAVAALLGNATAVIRDATLETLVAESAQRREWQAPLVARPRLSACAALALAEFLADGLLSRLAGRADLAPDVAQRLRARVAERLAVPPDAEETPAAAMERAGMLHRARALNEAAIEQAALYGEANFVTAALSLMAGTSRAAISQLQEQRDRPGLAGLCWRARFGPAATRAVQDLLIPAPAAGAASGGLDRTLAWEAITDARKPR